MDARVARRQESKERPALLSHEEGGSQTPSPTPLLSEDTHLLSRLSM